jgi:hypothetical protein
MAGKAMRHRIDAAARMPSSVPTTPGPTPACSPTSGRNAVRMSSMDSRLSDASMVTGIPGVRRMRHMVGFPGPSVPL